MGNPDFFQPIPQDLILKQRREPYPQEGGRIYPPLMGRIIQGDVSHVPPRLVMEMPVDTAANFLARIDRRNYPVQLAKGQSIFYEESIKFKSFADPRYKLEAHLIRPRVLLGVLARQNSELYSRYLENPGNVVYFDLVAKIQEEHIPPLRASPYLSWVLSVFGEKYQPKYILANWEPDSDNHVQYYVRRQVNASKIESASATWSHNQFLNLGFELVPAIDELPSVDKQSHLGFPNRLIQAFYKKK